MIPIYNSTALGLLGLLLSLLAIVTNSFREIRPRGFFIVPRMQKNLQSLSLFHSIDTFEEGPANKNICVLIDSGEDDGEEHLFRDDAERIAESLNVPLHSTLDEEFLEQSDNDTFSHALRLVPYEYCESDRSTTTTYALAIEPLMSDATASARRKRKPTKRQKPPRVASGTTAFFVDLCPPSNSRAGRRASGASGKADLLVKAVGPRKGPVIDPSTGHREGAVVWDLTAGLGQDALVLARNGAKRVRMVERHPVVAALLGDAIRRLELLANASELDESAENPAKNLSEILSLSVGEGRDALEAGEGCDVVYLDPMFPPRQKQSSVKKGMSILHGLLETHVPDSGEDGVLRREQRTREEQELLETALLAARQRVVVKRPIKAPPLGDGSTKPSHALSGSVNRWDVYVKPQNPTP